MSRTIQRRLVAQSPLTIGEESKLTFRLPSQCLRLFSNSSKRSSEGDGFNFSPPTPRQTTRATRQAPRSPSLNPKAAPVGGMSSLGSLSGIFAVSQRERETNSTRFNPMQDSLGENLLQSREEMNELPHLFSVYATRHNTHINVSMPPGKPKDGEALQPHPTAYRSLISLSAGNLGFRKSARKHYDSAFQVASFVMGQMQEKGWNEKIKKLEVHLRGFGAGREAVTKAILGLEGRYIRGKIVKVADNTRLKFGGTRSKKPRRLG